MFPAATAITFQATVEKTGRARFSLTALRDFGLGKTSLEDKILEETQILSDTLAEIKGAPVSLNNFLPKAVSNVISSIVFGSRFDYNDEEFESLLYKTNYIVNNTNYKLVENYFPFLEKVLPNSKVRKLLQMKEEFNGYVRKQIDLHKISFDRGNIRDFIDLYINQETNDSSDVISDIDLFQTIFDLYVAGSETTNTTLLWIFLFMIKYPKNCRLFDYNRQVVGNRHITLKDRDQLPYIVATVNEIQRLKTIAPMAVPKTALEDIQIDNLTIPKRSTMVEVIVSAHYDNEYWEKPEEFRPERFLDENNSIIRHEAFFPFGLGKRVCLGKQLAETELFLFFSILIQRFRFEEAKPGVLLDMEGISPGVTYMPCPYEVRLQEI
ncbi:cytochrome P450 2B4-like [Saccostrea cucullata]|uniref:cytochrome P450 2B4-like n=1 Tax=Saccostrea cuccullata TaxID=36930 RepID=UPI002ED2EDF0